MQKKNVALDLLSLCHASFVMNGKWRENILVSVCFSCRVVNPSQYKDNTSRTSATTATATATAKERRYDMYVPYVVLITFTKEPNRLQ